MPGTWFLHRGPSQSVVVFEVVATTRHCGRGAASESRKKKRRTFGLVVSTTHGDWEGGSRRDPRLAVGEYIRLVGSQRQGGGEVVHKTGVSLLQFRFVSYEWNRSFVKFSCSFVSVVDANGRVSRQRILAGEYWITVVERRIMWWSTLNSNGRGRSSNEFVAGGEEE